jgi:3-methyladenine DNA glycosylase AlkD
MIQVDCMQQITALMVQKALKELANPQKAIILQRFFKTGPGQYGEGDQFLGITVPLQRMVAKKHIHLSLSELNILITSPIHEHRLVALLILVEQFRNVKETEQQTFVDWYLGHTAWINNWDLVDLSAHYILGKYLLDKDPSFLFFLADSKNLWEQRIAVISSFAFIRQGIVDPTIHLAKQLLPHKHDLIHKAVGWMLREADKKQHKQVRDFLVEYYKSMPRTMLRYAIERYPEEERQKFLKGEI